MEIKIGFWIQIKFTKKFLLKFDWLFFKFNRVSTSNVAELDQMASSLHEAEETRDEALAYIAQHEVELAAQVAQTEAELQAAMDGLGDARREIAELRYYIEENSA